MSTVLTQVLDRLDVLLKATVPGGVQVFRDRAEAESRAEAPCIEVQARESQVEAFSAEMDKHVLAVDLRIHVRAEPATPAAEAIHQAVHGPIVTDATLAALCESRRLEDNTFTLAEADVTALDKLVRYRFTYLIPQSTL